MPDTAPARKPPSDISRPTRTLCWLSLAGTAFGLTATVFGWNGLDLNIGNPGAPGLWEQVLSAWPLYLGSGATVVFIAAAAIGPQRGRRAFQIALISSVVMVVGVGIDFVAHGMRDDWIIAHVLWLGGLFVTSAAIFAVLLRAAGSHLDEDDDEPDPQPWDTTPAGP